MKHSFGRYVLAAGLLLGLYRGQLALYTEGAALPLQVFPVSGESLPPADRLALGSGISVDTEEALAHLLEDYLS